MGTAVNDLPKFSIEKTVSRTSVPPADEESIKDCVDRMLHAGARAPRSTYRLQLHSGFNFVNAEGVLP